MFSLILFLTGFAGISLEIYWTRVLSLVFGGSVYAFSIILASYLLGIAIGSLIIYLFVDLLRNRLISLAILNLLLALSIIIFSNILPKLPLTFIQLFDGWGESFKGLSIIYFLISIFVMIVPTILMGMVFPLALIISRQESGKLYAINTLGGIFGAILASLLIMPRWGIQFGIYFSVAIYIVCSLILFFKSDRKRNSTLLAIFIIILTIVIGFKGRVWDKQILSNGFYQDPSDYQGKSRDEIAKMLRNSKMIFYKDGKNATVSVTKYLFEGQLSLRVNGKADASTGSDMENQVLLGHLPMFFHKDPKNVLVIGLGSGVTLGSIESYPVSSIDTVEIEPEVVEAAKLFKDANNNALEDKRLNLIIADGRNYLNKSNKKYDVISSEPSNLWLTGVSNLFTKEFYNIVREHLNDDGIVVQWLHIYAMSESDLKMAVATFSDTFPNALAFNVFTSDDLLLIGTKSDKKLSTDLIEEKLNIEKVKKDLERVGIIDKSDVLSYLTMDNLAIKKFVDGSKIHTDNRPTLEFSAPKSIYVPTQANNLQKIMDLWIDLEDEDAQLIREKFAQMMLDFTEYKTDEGISLGEQILALKPKKVGVKEYLSRLYFDKSYALTKDGKTQLAIEALERSLEIQNLNETRMILANIYLDQGEPRKAIKELKKVLEKSPDIIDAQELLKKAEELKDLDS